MVGGYSLFRCLGAALGPGCGKVLVAKLGAGFRHCPLIIESVDRWNGGANSFTQRLGCSPQLRRPYQFASFCSHAGQSLQADRDQFLMLDPLEDRKALLVEVTGRREVVLHPRYTRRSYERFGHACLITYFFERSSSLLEEGMRLCLVVLLEAELP